jgi:hypothetical protein
MSFKRAGDIHGLSVDRAKFLDYSTTLDAAIKQRQERITMLRSFSLVDERYFNGTRVDELKIYTCTQHKQCWTRPPAPRDTIFRCRNI